MGKKCIRGAAVKRVYVVTEGQSETNFVNRILAPYFLNFEKILIPTTVLTKADEQKGRMHKGGISNYEKARSTITKDLAYTKQSEVFVTTMFDFYALPSDTPGFMDAQKISDCYKKIDCIENAMLQYEELTRPVFIPYIQLHEFEALLFTNLDVLAEEYFDYDIKSLRECLENQNNPELINNGVETSPSKRILKCIPDYDKATMGVSILTKIGVDELCRSCKHFSEWIEKIKKL